MSKKRSILIAILCVMCVLFPDLVVARGVTPNQIVTGADVVLDENLGFDALHSYAVFTVTSGTSTPLTTTVKSGYKLMGISIYTTTDALITFKANGIDCVNAVADSSNVNFIPAELDKFFPVKTCDSLRVANSSGSSCSVYVTLWAKR